MLHLFIKISQFSSQFYYYYSNNKACKPKRFYGDIVNSLSQQPRQPSTETLASTQTNVEAGETFDKQELSHSPTMLRT